MQIRQGFSAIINAILASAANVLHVSHYLQKASLDGLPFNWTANYQYTKKLFITPPPPLEKSRKDD